jgi:putative Holliday junction resolvase
MNDAIKNGKGILLGIDFGDKRTGVAVSDVSRFLASARETVTVNGLNDCAEKIAAIAESIGASGIVLGLPVNMDGSYGPRAEKCQYLGEVLSQKRAAAMAKKGETAKTCVGPECNTFVTTGDNIAVMEAMVAEIAPQQYRNFAFKKI